MNPDMNVILNRRNIAEIRNIKETNQKKGMEVSTNTRRNINIRKRMKENDQRREDSSRAMKFKILLNAKSTNPRCRMRYVDSISNCRVLGIAVGPICRLVWL